MIFLGRVSEEDKARALHSADAYVAPNNGGESFGIILLEAMAAGAPVVASNIEAFERVLDEGRAGALFTNNDAQSLADAVLEVLASPQRSAGLRAAGYLRAAQFDWPEVAAKVVDVYESVNPGGEKVTVDLRHQIMGKWAQSPRGALARLGGDSERADREEAVADAAGEDARS